MREAAPARPHTELVEGRDLTMAAKHKLINFGGSLMTHGRLEVGLDAEELTSGAGPVELAYTMRFF